MSWNLCYLCGGTFLLPLSWTRTGAINADGTLNIRNNDYVLFEKNLSNLQSFYYLHAISALGSEFSAGEGKVIEFREAVRLGSLNSVNWNRDYTVNGETVKQTGDIVFTGAFVEENLNEMLQNVGAGRSASTKELIWSRCSLFTGESVLHGGRLRIEDGAIHCGQGMTVAEGSDATVRLQNAALCHGGYTLTFNPGTTLELHGNNAISGTVDMHLGSKIVIDKGGITDINGALYFLGNATFNLNGDKDSSSNNQVLLCVANEVYGWSNVQQNIASGGTLTWVDDLLILNYDANSYNRHFRGSAVYNSTQSNDLMLHHYNSVEFNDIRNSPQGGALTNLLYPRGSYRDSTSLRYNDSVIFRRNSASSSDTDAKGGAIYGGNSDSTGTTKISDNGSVIFDANTACSSASWANGGAIAAKNLTLNNNGSVIFKGNVVSSDTNSPAGGAIAIFSRGELNIRNNDSVLFEKNVEKSGSIYRLRSIFAHGNSPSVISLSSAAGKSIVFRDSVRIGSGSTVNLNADYGDIKQQGDIIFTGKYTEQHLNDLLEADGAGRVATAEEILNSRTSEVYDMTNLYGGRLCVEDGAVYKGHGITAHAGSDSTIRVKDAELNHAEYNITLNSGTTLELEGTNDITAAYLVMQEGSTLRFIMNEETQNEAAMSLTGNLLLKGAVVLTFDATPGVHRLVNLSSGTVTDWSNIVEQIDSGYNYELSYDDTGISLEVRWTEFEWSESCDELTLSSIKYGRANVKDDLMYNAVSVLDGTYQVTGEGSMAVAGVLSVTGGADVTLDLATVAAGVEVGDDSSLSLQKGLNLVSLMTLDDEETEAAKAISVGRNAELSLTDAALLGQVATADETSAVYYQTETGDKLLKFTGDLGNGGLNLTLGEDVRTVRATDSAGFTGNITVLTGTTLVNDSATATDGLAFGANYATAPDKTITVQGGATLDINGRETYYHLVLEKDALLTNSGTDTHHDWKGIPVIDLSGDAEVNAAAQICMVGADYATNTLNLNGNTLTKTGSANLVLRNTSINEGTLAVNGGLVRFMGNTSTAAGTGIQVNNGGTLWISEGTGTYAGTLKIGTDGRVYLGEPPQGTMGGDHGTDAFVLDMTGLGEVALAGGTLTFRGEKLSLGSVVVSADSTLEIWDQTGSDGVADHASTVSSLQIDGSAELTLATSWKSALNIAALAGDGVLKVGSSRQVHSVTVGDISGYSGAFEVAGSSSLTLTLGKDVVLDASRVTKDDDSTLVLAGTGSYNIGTGRTMAAGVTFAEDWQGSVRLTGTLAGDTLSGLSGADSWVELYGVSGYLSRADAQTGAQTYAANLKLTDAGETAAWDLNNGYKGDIRTFTGKISGEGTLLRSSYKGTDQTLIFTGDVSEWRGSLKHEPDSSKNSGAVVKTDVTFSGSSEINVAMRTNGKGELNVTIDDEHLSAGSKVTVNNAVSATNFTVTEGTAARLNSTLQFSGIAELQAAASLELGSVVTLAAGTEVATMEAISVSDSEIRGTAATSAIRNMQMREMNGDFSIANVGMHAVDISGSNATLTLANVNLDDTCSINLGSGGSISFADSMLGITLAELPVAGTDTLHIDCSALLQSSAYGNLELNFNFTTEEMYMRGYQTLSVEFGAAGDYSNLELSLSNAEFKGFVGSIAQFALAPEPATTTLSLLALSALAARRRRR